MGLANIANVPATQDALNEWSFSHAVNHRDIIDAIQRQFGVSLTEYIIDPFNTDNAGVWLFQHQTLHNDMNAILGIAGNDLLDVNWQDQDELSEWIFLNFTEHQQANTKLRI